MEGNQLARGGEKKRHGVGRNLLPAEVGRVTDHYVPFGRRREVNVVQSHAVLHDDLTPLQSLDDAPAQGSGGGYYAVRVAGKRKNLILGTALPGFEVGPYLGEETSFGLRVGVNDIYRDNAKALLGHIANLSPLAGA